MSREKQAVTDSAIHFFQDELHTYFDFHEAFDRISSGHASDGHPYRIYLTDLRPEYRTCPYGGSVIIRELSPAQADNYRRLTGLWNPYLESVYGVLEKEGHAISIHEFVEAPTSLPWEKRSMNLAEYVARFGCFSEKDALILLWQLAEAIRALQDIHFTHGDIAPQNILLTDTCPWETLYAPLPTTSRHISLKLIDFGTAKEKKGSNHSVTTVIGTKPFAAPEILDFRYPSDRVDIYSAGCVLYYMLTGRSPKEGGLKTLPKKSGTGSFRIISRCTADYVHRYKNAAGLQKDIIRQLYKPTGRLFF
ncbi:protein kinase [Lachnospiraceae bacterium 47-T17]